MSRHVTRLPSPLGPFTLVVDDAHLTQVRWPHLPPLEPTPSATDPVLRLAVEELTRYFAGEPVRWSVPIRAQGTAFQRAVWATLAKVPRGQTWTYQQIAQAVGRPRAMRAVGSALGANPLAIVQPCHRVIGVRGHLTGFAGGLDAKAWLLGHERPE